MSTYAIASIFRREARQSFQPTSPKGPAPGMLSLRLTAPDPAEDLAVRQAELFYLQKQIQSQTPMVIVLEDGEQIEGCIEWYDRNSLKVRGTVKALIYKSAIKYMYKLGDAGR
jgi:sRNA-binding regulator protein Hfq